MVRGTVPGVTARARRRASTARAVVRGLPVPNTIKPLSQRKEKTQLKRYRAGLLNNPMTLKVVEKSIDIAMDDSHPGQMQAMKMIMDRALPVRGFDMERQHADKGGITINITGLSESEKEVNGNVIEHNPDD